MTKIRVGINGFGRMGRLLLRAGWDSPSVQFVRINEIAMNADGAAHLLQFDTVHGQWPLECIGSSQKLYVNGHGLEYSQHTQPAGATWGDCDIVIEATGVHHKRPGLLNTYFGQGVKKVLVAAPTEGALNLVYGVNHNTYNAAQHRLVTAASCTTNCLAPLVQVMHERIGIRHGTMTTLHALTNTQEVLDHGHKDLRRARASGESLIPTTTGSAKAITQIFPELKGRLNGLAVRVPLLGASLTDFVFEAQKAVTVEEVNTAFREAAQGQLSGILGYEERPLVSIDYRHDPRSSIVDALSTMVINDTQVKVLAWYDNEWGYVNRMLDILHLLAREL